MVVLGEMDRRELEPSLELVIKKIFFSKIRKSISVRRRASEFLKI